MMPDVLKIADLAMLSLTETQKIRLKADMKEILSAGESMPHADAAESTNRSVSLDALSPDEAAESPDAAELLSLSEKEQDGYIVVSRTVGGAV